MNIVMMLLTAEYAAVESGSGKLNILGVYNRFKPDSNAESPKRVYLVTRIRGLQADSPSIHKLTVRLTDPSNTTLVEMSGNFNMPAGSSGVDPECDFVLEFNQLEFKQAGIYTFTVDVDEGAVTASTVIANHCARGVNGWAQSGKTA